MHAMDGDWAAGLTIRLPSLASSDLALELGYGAEFGMRFLYDTIYYSDFFLLHFRVHSKTFLAPSSP